MIVYHGSNVVVDKPDVELLRFYKSEKMYYRFHCVA